MLGEREEQKNPFLFHWVVVTEAKEQEVEQQNESQLAYHFRESPLTPSFHCRKVSGRDVLLLL